MVTNIVNLIFKVLITYRGNIEVLTKTLHKK